MTEAEWMVSDDPAAMLEFITGKMTLRDWPGKFPMLSDRRLRLFACACCRLVWPLLPDPRSRKAVEVAERYADGLALEAEILMARGVARGVACSEPPCLSCMAVATLTRSPAVREEWFSSHVPPAAQAALLRCIAGSPSAATGCADGEDYGEGLGLARSGIYPPHPDGCDCLVRQYRTPTALALATAAYAERLPDGLLAPDCLAVLADALEDAGCDSADLLAHLRGPGPHARGCWAVDCILGRD